MVYSTAPCPSQTAAFEQIFSSAALRAKDRAFETDAKTPVPVFFAGDPCRDFPAIGVVVINFSGHLNVGRYCPHPLPSSSKHKFVNIFFIAKLLFLSFWQLHF
jgi:hypothetical protein